MSGSLTAPKFFAPSPGATPGALAATGSTDGYPIAGPFNFTLSGGPWVGTVALEASQDGTTWVNCVMPDGTASAFTINGFYAVPNVWQRGVMFRLTFTRTSGTVNWSISQ